MQSGPGEQQRHSQRSAAAPSSRSSEQLAKVPGGRALYANYREGLVGPQWETDAQAACFVNAFQDLASADMYWHTDPNSKGDPQYGHVVGYAQTMDRHALPGRLDGQRKPIWNFVEVGWPLTEDPRRNRRAITPAEIRAAVWHSIIAGARGIIYFQHSFSGACRHHHVLGRRRVLWAVIDMVRSVNAQIKSLAPVLNAPTVTEATDVHRPRDGEVGRRALLRVRRLAQQRREHRDWSLPCVGNATAVRLGESGSVPVNGGSFDDQFADGNAVHIYRIDGGSDCGLPPGAGGGRSRRRPGPSKGTAGRARVGRLPRRVSLRSGRLDIPVRCTAACTVRSRLTTRVESRGCCSPPRGAGSRPAATEWSSAFPGGTGGAWPEVARCGCARSSSSAGPGCS